MLKKILPVALLALAATASPTLAKGGDKNEVRTAGSCGSGATSKLKLKSDDGRIEAEFEVDRNRNGEQWRVKFSRDGHVVARAKPTTHAPSGSFSVERRFNDLAGADRITARGTGPSGLTCTATATLPEAGASRIVTRKGGGSTAPPATVVSCDYAADGDTADGGYVFSNQAGNAGCISVVQRGQPLRLFKLDLSPGWTADVVKNGEGTDSTVLVRFTNGRDKVEARIELGKTSIR